MRRTIRVGYDLCDSVMVTQVDEQEVAMIALAVDPAGKANGGIDVVTAQFGAGVGSVGMEGHGLG